MASKKYKEELLEALQIYASLKKDALDKKDIEFASELDRDIKRVSTMYSLADKIIK